MYTNFFVLESILSSLDQHAKEDASESLLVLCHSEYGKFLRRDAPEPTRSMAVIWCGSCGNVTAPTQQMRSDGDKFLIVFLARQDLAPQVTKTGPTDANDVHVHWCSFTAC